MKHKVWYVASDTQSNGTDCQLFATEEEYKEHMTEEMLKDVPVSKREQFKKDLEEDWDETVANREDGLRSPLDTYNYGDAELEFPDPEPFSPEIRAKHIEDWQVAVLRNESWLGIDDWIREKLNSEKH